MSLTRKTGGVTVTSTSTQMGIKGKVIRVTPTIPIGSPTAFGDGDAMTETLVEIPNATEYEGGVSLLRNISIFNKDNEDCGIEVIFFENNSTSAFGTANAAPDITDANALANNPLGTTSIVAADQNQAGVWSIGTSGLLTDDHINPLMLQSASGSTSVYFAIVSRDTATLASTTDITLIFSIEYL